MIVKKSQLFFSLILLLSCSHVSPFNSIEVRENIRQQEIIISSAASLKNVMETVKPLFKKQYPQLTITYNFAASGTLQRQIEQGAPIDILISADRSKIDILDRKGLLKSETIQNLLQNTIVLIAQRNNKIAINHVRDLSQSEVELVALGEPHNVPAGKYAKEVLNYFQVTPQIANKAVYGKDVRQVLNYVATGNADVGMVYLTDAKMSMDRVKIVAIAPSESHSTINYAIAVVKNSKSDRATQAFVDFLNTTEIKKTFAEYGFIIVNNN